MDLTRDLCQECGTPIDQPATGRRRLTCSARCRQKASRKLRRKERRVGFRDPLRDVRLKPTIASSRGDTVVDQCSWCGALVAHDARTKLGQCPVCREDHAWWRQHLPVGTFTDE